MEYRVDNTIFLGVYSICPDMRKMKAIERCRFHEKHPPK